MLSTAIGIAPNQEYDYYAYLGGEIDTDDSYGAWLLRVRFYDSAGRYLSYTNAGGALTANQQYCAYGRKRNGSSCSSANSLQTDHTFTGQKVDGTGLQYYQSRYYDPVIGTFISPDTIVPDATNVFAYNRFMYTVGNPLNRVDPTGHPIKRMIRAHR